MTETSSSPTPTATSSPVPSTNRIRSVSAFGLIPNDQRAVFTWIIIGIVWSCVSSMLRPTPTKSIDRTQIENTIDINSATASELDLLEGIGPKLSARIIADREERGPFESVNHLKRVKGIGPKTIEKNRANLRADRP